MCVRIPSNNTTRSNSLALMRSAIICANWEGFISAIRTACVNSFAQSVAVVMCNRSMMRIVSLLSLLWSLVEVHSETFPRLSQVGRSDFGGNDLQCITDLNTCCTSTGGPHPGDCSISLMKLDCHSLVMVVNQLASIALIFQLMM